MTQATDDLLASVIEMTGWSHDYIVWGIGTLQLTGVMEGYARNVERRMPKKGRS